MQYNIYTNQSITYSLRYLGKIFEGVTNLEFNDELEVTKIKSLSGEVIALARSVSTAKARGQVGAAGHRIAGMDGYGPGQLAMRTTIDMAIGLPCLLRLH